MVMLTDHLGMTIAVDWDIKPQAKQTNNILVYISNRSIYIYINHFF